MQGSRRDAAVCVVAELESRDQEVRSVNSQAPNKTEPDTMAKRGCVIIQVLVVYRPIEVYCFSNEDRSLRTRAV
jgi:hypothetical protein